MSKEQIRVVLAATGYLDEAAREPDVFVERPIGQSLVGKDNQLDAAVEVLLQQIDSEEK